VKLTPIVALVPEETLASLDAYVLKYGEPTPLMQAAMDRNGWTVDAIIAGSMITFSLRAADGTRGDGGAV
jgi:hypothetical protein